MRSLQPVVLEGHGVRLEPLATGHAADLAQAMDDGRLWELWFTAVPKPDEVAKYIEDAQSGLASGHMLPWAVRELESNAVIGSTRYHDVLPAIGRIEIGYTWYARLWQRSHVNTACKLLLMQHAFDELQCDCVGFRTDGFNFVSQRAIEALGAKRDGVIRHHQPRKDGSPRDNVMYSILKSEWPDVRRHLLARLSRPR